jgi:tRNA (cytidine/uridine-2'-O-)-methyltransferase
LLAWPRNATIKEEAENRRAKGCSCRFIGTFCADGERHTFGSLHQEGPIVLHVALWEPEIPPNTGNIARLCAATGTRLHLVGRLGFRLDDRSLRRAGVDYWEAVDWHRHATLSDLETQLTGHRVFCFSARARQPYTRIVFQADDCLVFGGESHGLPGSYLEHSQERAFVIPMPGSGVRSLNLATAVGIVLYEALRQLHDW